MPYWKQRVLLHDHLDGSFTMASILPRLFRLSGKKYPFNPHGNVHADFAKLFKDPHINIVEKFSNTTGVMQSSEALSLAAENYVQVRSRQGFLYCEATIAPQYHIPRKMFEDGILNSNGFIKKDVAEALKGVVRALIEGIRRGEAGYIDIEVNLILAIGRELESLEAIRLVQVFAECEREYIAGIGLVCDEASHPPEKHKPMFLIAKELGFKTTCHAGEWCHLSHEKPNALKDKGFLLRNIRTAVYDLQVDRIGHAIPLAYDKTLTKAVLDRKIGVEGCPGSNLSSGLIPNTAYLKIRDLLDAGVLYSLNPDDDLFMPDLNEVFQTCNDEYRFTEDEKSKLLVNPWLSRFGNRKKVPISEPNV